MELLSILFVLVVAPTLFASSSLLKILQVNEVELLSFFLFWWLHKHYLLVDQY